jgi:hypothetical protein
MDNLQEKYSLDTQHYRVGDNTYYNFFQALDEEKRTGHFVQYELDPELIDSLQGLKKPTNLSREYIKNLMIKGLKKLRKEHNNLRLCLGGGTDSWTILKVCVENDIFLDEVATGLVSLKGSVRPDLEYLPGVKYAKRFEGKQIGTVKAITPTLDDLNYVNDPEWYKKTPGCILPPRPWFNHYYHQELKDPAWMNIVGKSKPSFEFKDGKVSLCHLDGVTAEYMGYRVVNFFCDKNNPELLVAMSYQLLDNLPKETFRKNHWFQVESIKDNQLTIKILEALGMKTPHAWLNLHFLGKKSYDQNLKTKYFNKELHKLGLGWFETKYKESLLDIYNQYKDLPYAVEKQGDCVKSIGRWSQKVPILQDKFGG